MLILNKQRKAEYLLKSLPYLPQVAEQVQFLASSKAFKQQILQLIQTAKSVFI